MLCTLEYYTYNDCIPCFNTHRVLALHLCARTRKHARTRTRTSTHKHAHAHDAHARTGTRTHARTPTPTQARTHRSVYARTHTTRARVYMRIFARARTHTHTPRTSGCGRQPPRRAPAATWRCTFLRKFNHFSLNHIMSYCTVYMVKCKM